MGYPLHPNKALLAVRADDGALDLPTLVVRERRPERLIHRRLVVGVYVLVEKGVVAPLGQQVVVAEYPVVKE